MKEQREKHIKRKGGKIRLHPYRGFWSVSCQRLQASALWSTWHAVAIPSLPSKHEGRGGHHDHCLCFNKTLFVELSTEADLRVCCSLSTASQILYWVILVTGFLGRHSLVISTGVLLRAKQNGCLSPGGWKA